jgi:anaerobic selenocysteine-containing dehydrogenase
LQLLYGPTRVKAPLKRIGEKGEGRWQTISWQQAIKEVADKLAEIRDQGNPQSVACLSAKDTGTVAALLQRLMQAYGSPNFVRMPTLEDTNDAVLALTQNTSGSIGTDVEHADFILSFGCGLLDGYGSPVRMFQANSQWKEKHATLVQIEPRLSNTAAKSDQWIPVNPGSEADLALAMAYVIIGKGLINKDFINNQTQGFNAFARMVKEKYAPDTVAKRIGIEVQTIVDLAQRFASAKKPLALYGRGKGQTPASLKEALAINALNALMGNLNQRGGVFSLPLNNYIDWPDMVTDSVAAEGLQTARLDGAGSNSYPHTRYLANRLMNVLKASPDKLQALLVAETNPCYSLPDAAAVREAVAKIPFVVSFSSFMDETAMLADLVLPNHIYLERLEDVPVTAGLVQPVIGLSRPVVEPQFNTRHLGDTIIAVAHTLEGSVGEAFPWEDYETCLQETLGDRWEALNEKSYLTLEPASAEPWYVFMDNNLGAVYLSDDIPLEGDAGSYPLVLMPYDTIRLASNHMGDPPFMIKTVPDFELKGRDGFVEINAQTAEKMGLVEGRPVRLATPKGDIMVRVHLSQGIAPDVIAMVRGLGHTAYDSYLAGKGVNVNELIGSVEDPASGLDAAFAIRAKLAKA